MEVEQVSQSETLVLDNLRLFQTFHEGTWRNSNVKELSLKSLQPIERVPAIPQFLPNLTTNLLELNLSYVPLQTDLASVLPLLQSLQSLERLNLCSTKFNSQGAKILAPVLARMTSLRALDLGWNDIGKDGAKYIGAALSNLANLEILNLDHNALFLEGLIAVGVAVPRLPKLKSISLYNIPLLGSSSEQEEFGIMLLLTGLPACLEKLNLSTNTLGPIGLQNLRKFVNLKELNLNSCELLPEDAEILAELVNSMPLLESLQLEGNELDEIAVQTLGTGLNHPTNISTFELSRNRLKQPSSSQAVGLLIEKMPKLKQLSLSNLAFSQQPDLLRFDRLTELEELAMVDCSLGADGVVAVVRQLTTLPALTKLNLARNNIFAAGASKVGEALAMLSQLEHLNLMLNYLTHEGLVAISPFLATLRKLKVLNLSMNKPTEETGEVLARSLVGLSGSTLISISPVDFTENNEMRLIFKFRLFLASLRYRNMSWMRVLPPELIRRILRCLHPSFSRS